MSKDFATNATCTLKFDVMTNRDGNVAQPGETVAGKKSVNFSGFNYNDGTIKDFPTFKEAVLETNKSGNVQTIKILRRYVFTYTFFYIIIEIISFYFIKINQRR